MPIEGHVSGSLRDGGYDAFFSWAMPDSNALYRTNMVELMVGHYQPYGILTYFTDEQMMGLPESIHSFSPDIIGPGEREVLRDSYLGSRALSAITLAYNEGEPLLEHYIVINIKELSQMAKKTIQASAPNGGGANPQL